MAMSEVKLYYYYLPNQKHEGWAEIVVGSNGFFAAVSDYGNYAFAWRHHGCDDFRKFLLRAPSEWSYFASKLGDYELTHQYDGEATRASIKTEILTLRRGRDMTRDEARIEWDHAVESSLHSRDDFRSWYEQQKLGPESYELARSRCDPGLEAFCKVTMGRLAELIRLELEEESAQRGPSLAEAISGGGC
jgi:hypothetical protein